MTMDYGVVRTELSQAEPSRADDLKISFTREREAEGKGGGKGPLSRWSVQASHERF